MGSGKGFTEEDEPNFSGSFYSYTKTMAEKVASGLSFLKPAAKGVQERADSACAHAHLGRPFPAKLHH